MLPEATETLSSITTYHTGFHLQPQTKRDVLNGCTDNGGGWDGGGGAQYQPRGGLTLPHLDAPIKRKRIAWEDGDGGK